MSLFTKASKSQLKLRMATAGVSGAGKTYTSLVLATAFGGRIAVIDSEHGKSQLYADAFNFDVLDLRGDFDPRKYAEAVRAAGDEGYDVIIIDSLSHAWDGALDMKDAAAKRSRSGDSFGAWREVTPVFNDLIDTILASPAHVLCTLRQKTAYEISNEGGKNKVQKLGLAPQFRQGVEYEFDIVADMDPENNWIVTKTRYPGLHGKVINRPGKILVDELKRWLEDGEPLASQLDIVGIRERIEALPADVRLDAKRQFKSRFGAPDMLVQSKLSDALAFVAEWEVPPAQSLPASPVVVLGGDESVVPSSADLAGMTSADGPSVTVHSVVSDTAAAPAPSAEPSSDDEPADPEMFDLIGLREQLSKAPKELQEQYKAAASSEGWGSLKEDAKTPITKGQLRAANALFLQLRLDMKATHDKRRKAANAAMSEVGIKGDKARHELVQDATDGATSSTKELTAEQLTAVINYCKQFKEADGEE